MESDLPTLVIASRSNGPSSLVSIRRRLSPIDPSGIGGDPNTGRVRGRAALPVPGRRHWVASALSVIALLLTITGIYGVLAFVVALREKEIGIRLALGATRRAIIALVVRQSIRLAAIGVVAGAADGVRRGALHFGTPDDDPRVRCDDAFVSGMVVVLTAALTAAYAPSRRAASVDPVESLKG